MVLFSKYTMNSPLLQLPPLTNHHLIQTTAGASYVLAPLHPQFLFHTVATVIF